MAVTWVAPSEITPASTGWQDVDVSGSVPADATGVIVHLANPTGNTVSVGWRMNGSTDNRVNSLMATAQFWLAVGLDANRVFELSIADVASVDAYLVGYFTNDAVFYVNAPNISLGSTGSWLDIDISALTGTDTAIGAVVEIYSNGNLSWGLRQNGSTDNRVIASRYRACAVIGVDGNEVMEGQIDNVNCDFYLTGYITKNATFNVNASVLSPTVKNSWQDLAALPAGATGRIIEVTDGILNPFGLRKNGSSEDIRLIPNRSHAYGLIEADAAGIVEGFMSSSSNGGFYGIGYMEAPPTPAIANLSPDHGAQGDSITITGTSFEATTGTVTVGGVAATVVSWTDTEIVITVPVGVASGTTTIVVTSHDGYVSDGYSFTVEAAAISGSAPGIESGITVVRTGMILCNPPVRV